VLIALACAPGGAWAGDLAETRAINMREILEGLDLIDHPDRAIETKRIRRFETLDPYHPAATELVWAGSARRDVLEWYADYDEDESVCAIQFVDSEERDYRLATFASQAAAEEAGWIVTHHHPCGACSSLADLEVYLTTPDLTTPARACAMRLIGARSRRCFIRTIGFTPWCAEAWAANARHTRKHCKGICIREYGLLNMMRGNFSGASNNTPDGELSPCIQCDETMSAAGFKYAAGRTRRNSGIESAIERKEGEQKAVDHSRYFTRSRAAAKPEALAPGE
jgi:hypothetical protein